MTAWNNSRMDYVYYDSTPASEGMPCIVRIDEAGVMVAYEHDGDEYRYTGESSKDGHFNLVGDGFDGRASLHMFIGSSIMEGFWSEDGAQGFWRLHLE